MTNKIVFMVLAGVFAFLWYWVGYRDYYNAEAGGISDGYFFVTALTVALMRS